MRRKKVLLGILGAVVALAVGRLVFHAALAEAEDSKADEDLQGVVLVEADSSVHRKFIAAELDSGVPVAPAVAVHLVDAATSNRRLELSKWSMRSADDSYVFGIRWSHGDGDRERTARFRFDAGTGEVTPESDEARRIAERAEKISAVNNLDVLPKSYVPDAEEGEVPWSGTTKKVCQLPTSRDNCRTMEAFFDNRRLISDLGWVFGALFDKKEAFTRLREEGECKWRIMNPVPAPKEQWASHRVIYVCAGEQVLWNFNRESRKVSALSEMSRLLAQLHSVAADGEEAPTPTASADLRALEAALNADGVSQ